MQRPHPMYNPKLSPTMSSPHTTNVTNDQRQPTFTTPPPRPQEQPQPVLNPTPMMNNSTFLKNIGCMSEQQFWNVMRNLPKYGNSVEIAVPYQDYNLSNRIDPSMPYFVTTVPPMPGKVILTSALSQLGMVAMKEWMNMHNIYSRFNPYINPPTMTPVCHQHLKNISQINPGTSSARCSEVSTQTVATIETQTEEQYFYESCGMPRSKRGRRRNQL